MSTLGTPSRCRFLSYEPTLPLTATRWDLGPAADRAAGHAPFDPREAFVRALTTANHLIVSQHVRLHGKKGTFISLNGQSSRCLH